MRYALAHLNFAPKVIGQVYSLATLLQRFSVPSHLVHIYSIKTFKGGKTWVS